MVGPEGDSSVTIFFRDQLPYNGRLPGIVTGINQVLHTDTVCLIFHGPCVAVNHCHVHKVKHVADAVISHSGSKEGRNHDGSTLFSVMPQLPVTVFLRRMGDLMSDDGG